MGSQDAPSCYPAPRPLTRSLASALGTQLGAASPAPSAPKALPHWASSPQARAATWKDKPSFPTASLFVPGCPAWGTCLHQTQPSSPGEWAPAQSPLAVPTHLRPRQTLHPHSAVSSDLQLRVEVEGEVGRCIGCGRRHVPWRRGRAKSVAEGTVKGCWGEVHKASGHG